MNLPFFIARRYLANQKGTFSSITRLAIVATTLSVAVMILSLAVVTGFDATIREKLFSFNGHVHLSSFDLAKTVSITTAPIYKDPKLMKQMSDLPHVTQVAPFVQRPVIVQARGHMEGIQLKGVNNAYKISPQLTITGKGISYADSTYSREILLSTATAAKLDVNTGDTVQLEFFNGETLPRIRKVRISGLYHSGLDEVDKYFALCDMKLLQRINNWTTDSINAYELDLDNPAFADTVSNYIHYNLINAPLESNTTAENYPNIFDWLDFQTRNGVILLIIMTIVSVINMGAVLLILMVDRAAMIGLLKALGMTYKDTVKVFLYIGGIIGTAGIVFGNLLALGICWAQLKFGFLTLPEETYFMKYAPIKLVWWHVLATDLGSLFIFVVCMWLPALYIRTIQPAKVLQFK